MAVFLFDTVIYVFLLISNFRRVLNIVCNLLGISPSDAGEIPKRLHTIMYFYCYVYVFLLYVYVFSSCQLALFGNPD